MWKKMIAKVMSVINKEQCTPKLFGYGLLLCLVITFVLLRLAPTHVVLNEQGKSSESVWFGNRWFYGDGELVIPSNNLQYVSLQREASTIRIHKMITEPTFDGDYLCFRTKVKSIRVYKNNVPIYDYTTSHKYAPFSPVCYTFYQIPISGLVLNDRLTIELSPVDHPLIIQYFCLGEQYEIVRYVIKEALDTILICFCALFLVLLIITVYSSPTLDGQNYTRKAMFWLASFLILSIIWLISDNGFLELFISNTAVLYWLGTVCVYLLPIPFIIYTKYLLFPEHNIFNVLCSINLMIFFLSVIAFFLNIYDFSNTYVFIHLLIAVSILIFSFYIYKERLSLHFIVFLGTFSLFISALFSITSYWSLKIFPTSTSFGYGLVIYSICMLIWTIQRSSQERKQRVEAEREQLQREKENAELANSQKTRFLSHMSHEIRTPLNAVLGMNSLILRESDDEKILHYAQNIETAGNTLLSLINDILDLSKIESGKMDIIPAQYSVSSIVHDMITMLQVRALEKGLELQIDVNQNLPDILYGDEIRIKQIITNFLTNAVKYTQKGWIKLSIQYEEIPENSWGSPSLQCKQACSKILLIISVSDTGIGIKKDDVPKLFENFERLDSLKNRSIEGSGLGLSITSQLISLMQGTIDVQSIYGVGSNFTAKIPQEVISLTPIGDYQKRYETCLQETTVSKEIIPHYEGKRILIIDDNELNLEVLSSIVEMMGIQVTRANSGAIGLAHATKEKFDLILTDDMMPEINGTELMQAVKKLDGCVNQATPIVVVTANAVLGMKENYLQKGFDGYLTKPLDVDHLQKILSKLLV